MPRHPYRHADLAPLTGGIRELNRWRLYGEIESAGEGFTQLASADDIPPLLRRYYAKVGKKLTVTGTGLKQYLKSAALDGKKLELHIHSALGRLKLAEEDMNRLRHVNNRLRALEKSLKQMSIGMSERLEGLDPSGVEWDEWDMTEVVLYLEIGTDSDRPAYDPDAWEEAGLAAPLEIRVPIHEFWKHDKAEDDTPWGLDDGKDYGDLGGCEGHPLQNFSQSYLFHEFYDHADVGAWGMLHLQSLWIEIKPHRSGNFHI